LTFDRPLWSVGDRQLDAAQGRFAAIGHSHDDSGPAGSSGAAAAWFLLAASGRLSLQEALREPGRSGSCRSRSPKPGARVLSAQVARFPLIATAT